MKVEETLITDMEILAPLSISYNDHLTTNYKTKPFSSIYIFYSLSSLFNFFCLRFLYKGIYLWVEKHTSYKSFMFIN